MSNVIQLEAFEASLRAKRTRWFLSPAAPIAYPPGFNEQMFLESPSYTKRILVTTHISSEAWKLVDKWDIIIIPSTAQDWSLLLTILFNTAYPLFVVLTPETRPPYAFFTKAQQAGQKAPTIVQFQYLMAPIPPAVVTFDATFFPPTRFIDENGMEATETLLRQLVGMHTLNNFVLKDAIRDLKSAGATLVISSIDEREPNIYWYYATETKKKSHDTITSIIQTLVSRE